MEPRLGFGPRTYGLQSRRSNQAELPGQTLLRFYSIVAICSFGSTAYSWDSLEIEYQAFLGVGVSFSRAGVAQLWLDAQKGRLKRWTHKDL